MKKQKHTCNRLLIGLTVALLLVMTGAHAAQTTRVSVSLAGENGHSSYSALSADGRYVAFSSDANNLVAGD